MSIAKTAPDDLSALVGSRICHDLVNPLGAIGNGLELLHMAGIPDSPELTLISQAVAAAQGRLALYRLAFGAAGGNTLMGAGRLGQIVTGAFLSGQVKVQIDIPDQTRPQAKALALAVLCLEAALPRGGRIAIASDDGTLALAAQGVIRPLPDLWAMLADPPDDPPAPGQVQFALLGQMMSASAPPTRSETSQSLRLGLSLATPTPD